MRPLFRKFQISGLILAIHVLRAKQFNRDTSVKQPSGVMNSALLNLGVIFTHQQSVLGFDFLSMWALSVLTAIGVSVVGWLIWRRGWWKRRGLEIAHRPECSLLWGHMRDYFLFERNEVELVEEAYRDLKGRGLEAGGLYYLGRPALLVVEPSLVRAALSAFNNHPEMSPLRGTDRIVWSLFLMRDQEWRGRRTLLNPLFTPKRLRSFLPAMKASSAVLPELFRPGDLELEAVFQRYTTEVVVSALYGVDTGRLREEVEEEAGFLRCGRRFGRPSLWVAAKTALFQQWPSLCRRLPMTCFDPSIWPFFHSFVGDVVRYREEHDVRRDDLIGALLQIKNDPEFRGPEMTLEEMTGHAYVFFDAGYDTTTLTLSLCLYELGRHPEVQDRLREEIFRILADGEPTCELLQELAYADRVISETLRLYPPVGVLKRESSEDKVVGESGLGVEAGTMVLIPVWSLHRDPDIFPDPDSFLPERFETPQPLYSFGKGPRLCIGFKFAEMEMKVALSTILRKFRIEPSEKMVEPIKFDPTGTFITGRPLHGVWVNVRPL